MLDVANLPLDFSIGYYIPTKLWNSDVPPHGYTYFIAAIKAFSAINETTTELAIEDAILLLSKNLCGFSAVTIVPSHHKNGDSQAGIYRIAKGLAERSNGTIIDATPCLFRTKGIERLAGGGDRDVPVHINSIQLRNPHIIEGKRVLLLDDVRCTGNSLKACQDILTGANPRSVHPLALAQSLNNDMEKPEIAYAYVEHDIHNAYQQHHRGLDYEEESELNALQQLQNFAR